MKRDCGFSIVELMVAITLALLVTGAVLSVFAGSRNAYQSTTGVAALTDGGRFALDYLQGSIRTAGYMACNNPATQISQLNASTSVAYNFAQPLGGYSAIGTGPIAAAFTVIAPSALTPDGSNADWLPALDASLGNLVIKNNDVLVTRSTVAQAQAVYVTAITDGSTNFTVNSSAGLVSPGLAVISDCAKSAVMQISIAGTTINHIVGGGGSGNALGPFPVSFAVGSQVTPVDTIVYYIGKGADGDGALFSMNLAGGTTFGAPVEVVPDIESMQILYGVDTTSTQTVSAYVTADAVPDFNNVMSVKIAVLSASQIGAARVPAVAATFNLLGTTVTAPLDTRRRQVFDMTVAVRNMVD